MTGRRTVRAVAAAFLPVITTIGWVATFGIAAIAVPAALAEEHPRLAFVMLFVLAAIAGEGGLVGFWKSDASIYFLVRGWRVRAVTPTLWVYEERGPDGVIQKLPFGYTALDETYRPPCEVHITSVEQWNVEAPSWARHRRAEIVANISRDLGADSGRAVHVVDLREPLDVADSKATGRAGSRNVG
jgi:hypothetical protein